MAISKRSRHYRCEMTRIECIVIEFSKWAGSGKPPRTFSVRVFLMFLLAKQRVERSAKSGEILQLDCFNFIQH